MNPRKFFSLTDKQKKDYQIQPDGFLSYDWEAVNEEYEIPPFLPNTSIRFGTIRKIQAFLPIGTMPRKLLSLWKKATLSLFRI